MTFDRERLASCIRRLRQWASTRERVLAPLRARWGKAGDNNGVLAARYFELTRNLHALQVDDRTWVDLEFPKIFADIDTTVTPVIDASERARSGARHDSRRRASGPPVGPFRAVSLP